jgi:hypothetical protein
MGARILKTRDRSTMASARDARASRRGVIDRGFRSNKKKPSTLTSKVLGSGDVLLSRGLSPHYHRGCSVSLPCSEWERVVPLRYYHQNPAPLTKVLGSGGPECFRGRFLVIIAQWHHPFPFRTRQ